MEEVEEGGGRDFHASNTLQKRLQKMIYKNKRQTEKERNALTKGK